MWWTKTWWLQIERAVHCILSTSKNVHISEQLKITLKVTLHGMIFKQQVPVLAGFLSLQATPSHADRTMMPFLLHTGLS